MAVDDRHLATALLLGKGVVEGGMPRRDTELRMLDDVGHPLAAVVHLPSVPQTVQILLRRTHLLPPS